MKISDREITDSVIKMINSATHLIVKLLDEEIEIVCMHDDINVAQLTRLGKARDRFNDTGLATEFLMKLPF